MKRLLATLLVGSLLLGSGLSLAQEEALFTLVSEDPVIRHSDQDGDWDDRFTDPGAVFYHEGQFHMFRNGFQNWPDSVQIGYLTSADGITWVEQSPDPVLTTAEVPYAGLAALASSATVLPDGTWVLYFYTWENRSRTARNFIGRATALNPLGPWTVDSEPLLSPGAEGAWDDLGVLGPRIIQQDATWYMYYSAANSRQRAFAGIGLATSADGITWVKYNDPATTSDGFAESDPVLQAESERSFVHQPSVQPTADGWVLFYRTAPIGQGDSAMSIRYATSTDGIQWERGTAPIWQPRTIPGISGFWWTASARRDDTYYLYVEGGSMGGTNIYAGTFSGSFTP